MDCAVDGCTKPLYNQKLGLCAAHYQKHLRYGTATPTEDMKSKRGPKPDPSKPRSRHNPDNPKRLKAKKPRAERTHCPQGHALTTDNTYLHKTSNSLVCKTCAKSATRKYRQTRDTRDLSKCRRGHPITPENTVTYGGRDRCAECVRINAHNQRLKKYNITQSEYDRLLTHQGGVCAVCHLPMAGSRDEVVDHDHTTGQVRGILHGRCNVALGMLDDDPEKFLNAAKYLMDSWRLEPDTTPDLNETAATSF